MALEVDVNEFVGRATVGNELYQTALTVYSFPMLENHVLGAVNADYTSKIQGGGQAEKVENSGNAICVRSASVNNHATKQNSKFVVAIDSSSIIWDIDVQTIVGNNGAFDTSQSAPFARIFNHTAFAGTDLLNWKLIISQPRSTVGAQEISGVGFKPNFIHAFSARSSGIVDANAIDSYGFLVDDESTVKQYAQGTFAQNTQTGTSANNGTYAGNNYLIAQGWQGAQFVFGRWTDFNTTIPNDGWNMFWDTVSATQRDVYYLACEFAEPPTMNIEAMRATAGQQLLSTPGKNPKFVKVYTPLRAIGQNFVTNGQEGSLGKAANGKQTSVSWRYAAAASRNQRNNHVIFDPTGAQAEWVAFNDGLNVELNYFTGGSGQDIAWVSFNEAGAAPTFNVGRISRPRPAVVPDSLGVN